MREALLVWILAAVVGGRGVIQEKQRWSGRCSLFGSAIAQFGLPQYEPLLSLEVRVGLTGGENRDEYLPPQPRIYLRYDAVPSEDQHDSTGIAAFTWFHREARPKKATELYLLVTGGLETSLQLQCAYSPKKWRVTVELGYTYCRLGKETDNEGVDCEDTVWTLAEGEGRTGMGGKGQMLVSEFVEEFRLRVEGGEESSGVVVVSPWNYAERTQNQGFLANPETYILDLSQVSDLNVRYPRPGIWYIQPILPANVSQAANYAVKFRQFSALSDLRLLPSTETDQNQQYIYETIPVSYYVAWGSPEQDSRLFYYTVDPDTQFLKITLKIELVDYSPDRGNDTILTFGMSRGSPNPRQFSHFNGTIASALATKTASFYATGRSPGLLLPLNYLYPGPNFLHISLSAPSPQGSFGIGLVASPCGVDQCSGEPCELVGGVLPVYACDCRGHRVGKDCSMVAFPDWMFGVWVAALTLSNLAMIPAILLSLLRYHKYGESCIYLSTMLTSFIYHSCDSQFFCFGLDSTGLRHTDFYLSYLSIVVSVIYLARIENPDYKLAVTLFYVVLMLYCMSQSHFNSLVSEVLIPMSAGLVPAAKYVAVLVTHNVQTERHYWSWTNAWRFLFLCDNFRWTYGVLALLSFATGLTCNLVGTNYGYWLVLLTQTHSLWHIFIMLTPALVMCVFTPQASVLPFVVAQRSEAMKPLLPQ